MHRPSLPFAKLIVGAACAAALAVSLAPAASAHSVGAEFVAVFDRVSPASDDIEVRIAQTGEAPEITIRVTGDGQLILLGTENEPFARVTRRRGYFNERSPTWYRMRNPRAKKMPSSVDAGLPPRWKAVDPTSTGQAELVYREPRAEWPKTEAPEHIVRAGKRARLIRWSVPGTYGGRPVELVGHVDWVPQRISAETAIMSVFLIAATGWAVWEGVRRLLQRTHSSFEAEKPISSRSQATTHSEATLGNDEAKDI